MQDLFIIGGGINGVGIAADAAGRGLSVTLCEEEDFGSGTSSASSKLIHGGLRYLEYYQFHLVREALRERKILLKKAPHLVQPLRFLMPYHTSLRPEWMLRVGFFLYDHLGGGLEKSRKIKLERSASQEILAPHFKKAFIYSDCFADDARLVIANALQAKQYGAMLFPRTRFTKAERKQHSWEIEMVNTLTGEKRFTQAKVLINAAGPWAHELLTSTLHLTSKTYPILVKGSHIVVPKIPADPFAYVLQNSDGRMIFVIPFLDQYSLVGTTDILFSGNPRDTKISREEIDYLCAAVNHYFTKQIAYTDIVWEYSGVRPLQSNSKNNVQNPASISRDYRIEINNEENKAPLLSVFGGKLTTHRRLAERVLDQLKPFLKAMQPAWTAHCPLPGGNFPDADFEGFYRHFKHIFSWLPCSLAKRYAKNYGTLALKFLQDAKNIQDLGQHFGFGLYQRELDYLIQNEWVHTAEDVLWRRTKLGIDIPKDKREEFETVLNDYILK